MMRKIFVFLGAFLLLMGCSKEDNTYRAQIRVVTTAGIPIQNSAVKLYVPVDGSNVLFAYTDDYGIVEFEIPHKAFYDVKVWKGSWRGCGYVEFLRGETVYQDVYIRTFGDPLNTCWD